MLQSRKKQFSYIRTHHSLDWAASFYKNNYAFLVRQYIIYSRNRKPLQFQFWVRTSHTSTSTSWKRFYWQWRPGDSEWAKSQLILFNDSKCTTNRVWWIDTSYTQRRSQFHTSENLAGRTWVSALCPPIQYLTPTLLSCVRWGCIDDNQHLEGASNFANYIWILNFNRSKSFWHS